jgi:hypothetical protein
MLYPALLWAMKPSMTLTLAKAFVKQLRVTAYIQFGWQVA